MSRVERKTVIWVVGMIALGGWMHWKAVGGRALELRSMRSELRAAGSGDAQGAAVSRLAALTEEWASLKDSVPLSTGVSDVVDRLKHDLGELGVADCSWSISAPDVDENYLQTALDVGMTIGFGAVHELLVRISAYERVVRIESVAIEKMEDRGGGALRVMVRLLVMSRLAEEPSKGDAKAGKAKSR